MESIFLWGIIVAVLGVLFYRAKPAGKGEWHDDFLSLTTSKSLLGIAAVLIVLHHLAQLLGNLGMDQGPLACLEDVGVCFVGLFFFFSGYGLICSKNGKADYFKTFLRKRFPSILVPFYFCIIIFVIFSLLMQMPMSVPEIAAYLSGWWLLNTQMWYVVEIAFFYLAFYLVFQHVRNEKTGIVIMGILIGIMVAASILIGHGPECESDKWLQGEWWFNTSFMFLFGMIAAHSGEKIIPFVKKRYPVVLIVCLVAAVGLSFPARAMIERGTYYCEYEGSFTILQIFMIKFVTLLCQFAMVFFADAVVLMAMMKIKCENRITRSLGSVSLELYLIHNLYLIMFGYMGIGGIADPAALVYVSVICSLITAYIIHIPIRRLVHCITS
ncbi:MAG: acyltransferase family protein [Lachnospiraceae bacterium]